MSSNERVAVLPGHADIREQDVGPALGDHVQRLSGGRRCSDARAPRFQEQTHQIPHVSIVIDDKDLEILQGVSWWVRRSIQDKSLRRR